MELAKIGFSTAADDIREVILPERGLVAYDIWLVHYHWDVLFGVGDIVDHHVAALSKRREDMVRDGALELTLGTIVVDPAIFAMVPFFAGFDTSGFTMAVPAHTIPYPKPYRVPYAAFILSASSSITLVGACEVYYEEVGVSAAEMAYLRRRTDIIRTAPS